MNTLLASEPLIHERASALSTAPQAYRKTLPGSDAEDELVRENLPLVKTMVGRIAMTLPAHVDPGDLQSAAMVGLLNAVRHFDPQGGSSFASYARVRIRGAIMDELRRLDWVPRSIHEKARKVQSAIHELEQQTGELPEPYQVAEKLGVSLAAYERLIEEIKPITFVSLDCNPEDDMEDTGRYESLPDPSQRNPSEAASDGELSRLILARLEQLPSMQKKVLALYYFEDMRLREIAEVFGVSESRICQVHAQAILAIKAAIHRDEACVADTAV